MPIFTTLPKCYDNRVNKVMRIEAATNVIQMHNLMLYINIYINSI